MAEAPENSEELPDNSLQLTENAEKNQTVKSKKRAVADPKVRWTKHLENGQ